MKNDVHLANATERFILHGVTAAETLMKYSSISFKFIF